MHTIKGHPAMYDGEQIVYAPNGVNYRDIFCSSLKQIRTEQKQSSEWRIRQGFDDCESEYDYFRIRE